MKETQRRIIAADAIVLILIIIVALPLSFLSEYLIALTMIFGALMTISLGVFLASFKNIRESEGFGFVVLGLIIFFFIISAGIIYYQVAQESDEMTNNSLVTTGKIIDGKIRRGRRSSSAEIKIEFTTTDGQQVQASEFVTEREFGQYHIGKEVKIQYSKSSPNVINIVRE